jgi:general L-amino acid transport system permease protein
MSELSYVRTEMLGDMDPPLGETGIIRWLRVNMFSSIPNGILTVLAIYFIYSVLSGILPWIFQSSWTAGSLKECREAISLAYGEGTEGACWAVINERYNQLLFGFYPSELYWRPILAFFLMGLAIAPVLFDKLPRKLLLFSMIYPFLGFWLIWGGSFWVPLFALVGFAIAYLAATLLPNYIGSLGSVIAAIVLPLIWWLTLMGPIDSGLSAFVGDIRLPGAIAKLEQNIASGTMTDDEVVTAKRALKRLQDFPELKATLVKVDSEIASLRAGLPDDLADLKSLKTLPDDISPEDRDKLSKVLVLEGQAVNTRNSINSTYQKIGGIGLTPVSSDQLGGFTLSIIIGITGITLSLPIGILLALGRQSDLFVVKTICVGFIEFIRGVPLITLLFVASTLLNYFMPPGTSFDLVLRVMIMVTLFASAYMAEVIRGGLAALPKGQYEAADALGLDYWKSTRLIIMPQALKISIPNIVSNFIGLFKDTTLVSIIGLLDPIGLSTAIRANQEWNGIVWELYAFVALMFWLVCFSMSRYSMYLERKLKTGH